MTPHRLCVSLAAATILASGAVIAGPPTQGPPLVMDTARVTIAGTSNVHKYTIWTDTVRLTRVALAPRAIAPDAFWDEVVKPGAVEHFEIAVPVATLTSRDPGLDKTMAKALKLEEHRDITFRLKSLEAGTTGVLMAVGRLRIAGVEREVVMQLQAQRSDETLVVRGRLPLLMTDFGIAPPTAMMGMLKTDPKIIVAFEVVLSAPGT